MQKAFIETQFPIARLSAESYKERKAGSSQTLTGLGKWWGRKPLILVRACILGMLMQASNDPKKDREIFLKILTMDDDGTWQRQKGDIPIKAWREVAPAEIQNKYFGARGFQRGISDEEKEFVLAEIWEGLGDQQRARLDEQRKRPIPDRTEFDSLPYSERLDICERPENVAGPLDAAWDDINTHLGTSATSLAELAQELGHHRFGHTPKVGDAFCGGGSIPFEAARIGCTTYTSDLNPVAGLLTWASLKLIGADKSTQGEVCRIQELAFSEAAKQINQWGIERNEAGEQAEAFLYCVEAKPEGCDYYIPLAPNWVIAEKYRIVVDWEREEGSNRLQPKVHPVSSSEFKLYKDKQGATILDGRIVDPFDSSRTWSIEALRGHEGLRRWTNDDIRPRPEDVFQERLYCIRWGDASGGRRYAAPSPGDMKREERVFELLMERFHEWQGMGFVPTKKIVNGYNTDQPIRERGWTHWHHLFSPRQLLVHGTIARKLAEYDSKSPQAQVASLLAMGMLANWDSKLCIWNKNLAKSGGIGAFEQTFANQALNTLFNFGSRSFSALEGFRLSTLNHANLSSSEVEVQDARDISTECDIWLTDPPYADAVNYHELADFFLAWMDKRLESVFPGWIADSRTELAVRGDGGDFRRSMVEIYGNLASLMPDNGMQLVMFTHQNPAVWADLGMILWAAGLKATAAWTISTETAAGLKKGNYVQGTVCLVLRKRIGNEPGFLFDIYPIVEDEVRAQLSSMQALDEEGEPNFSDSDYQLAAYAAALKVLTQYSTLDGKNVVDEVFAVRSKNEMSDFEQVIERAITIACDELIPKGLNDSWRELSLIERYYLRAVDIESRGERRKGMYEELARGFGVADIKPLLKSDKANGTCVYTPSGFGTSLLAPIDGAVESTVALPRRGRASASGPHPFAASPLRHLLFAICETAAADNDPNQGRQYLRDTFGQTYWGRRESMVRLLDWLAALGNSEDTADWAKDSEAARILAGRLRNDDA
jgi:adenine-specific DNA methylase